VDKRISPAFAWTYAIAAILDLILILAGVGLVRQDAAGTSMMAGAALLTAGWLGFVALLLSIPIAFSIAEARQSTVDHHRQSVKMLDEHLQGMSTLMNLISEQQLLSDRAKQVAFRVKDREAVRRAVTEEIAKQDWEAAFVLAEDIEASFGYKQEADRLRQEITARRDEFQLKSLTNLLEPVDRYIKAEAWGAALQEAQRIMGLYPDDPHIQRLPEEIETRRQMRKKQLRESWQDAVNRHDVDGSIEILKTLDLYLTPAEVESMQEIARNVFKDKREDLRTRFATAVKEHKWSEALKLGDEIINDFPNTRIAQEVREKMDVLRKRAGEPETASA
jgi:hypothetical protein